MEIKKYLASKYNSFLDKYADLAIALSGSDATLSGIGMVASDITSDAGLYSASAFATSTWLAGTLFALKAKKLEDELAEK